MFSGLKDQYGVPVFGEKGEKLDPITDKSLPAKTVEALRKLPRASKVK